MNILDQLTTFAFAIIPGSAGMVANIIKEQGSAWANHEYSVDITCVRDIRIVCLSPDGPERKPAVKIAIMLSEVEGPNGPITLFVSSVKDGYVAMVIAISKKIPGEIVTFRIGRMDRLYPGNFIQSFLAGKSQRIVYAARTDRERWEFLEQGKPLPFEDPHIYEARRKRDLLNPEVIEMYLHKLGYVSLDQEFWITRHEPARLLAHKDFRLWHESATGNE
jgi:hypothetical protein